MIRKSYIMPLLFIVATSSAMFVARYAGARDFIIRNATTSAVYFKVDGTLGYIGIGTSTPSYKLDVVGTSQFSQPVIVGTPTAVTHATTKSYVDSMFTGSGQWTTNGGLVYLTSTTQNVGIGTTAPTQGKLVVSGGNAAFLTGSASSPNIILDDLNTGLFGGNDNIGFSTGGVEAMRIISGNVGIGTTGPVSKFHTLGAASSPSLSANNEIATIGADHNIQLALGSYLASPYGFWLQTKDSANNGAAYPLLLNPISGNVGIGTTAPNNKLQIGSVPSYSGNQFAVGDGTNQFALYVAGTPTFYSNNNFGFMSSGGGSGNVGIGTSTPSYKLDVVGTSQFSQPVIVGTPTANPHAATKSYVDSMFTGSGQWTTNGGLVYLTSTTQNVGIGTVAPGAKLSIKIASSGTGILLTDPSDVAGNYQQIRFQYSDTDAAYGSSIRFRQTDLAQGGNLSFWTDQVTTGTPTERMTIDKTGNVGIGTTGPLAKLHIKTGSAGTITPYVNSQLVIENNGVAGLQILTPDANAALITFGSDSSDNYQYIESQYNGGSPYFTFFTGGGHRFRIQSDGNVGIGTSTPSYKLDVVGTSQFSQPVIVGTPTAAIHATTKSYVDSMFTGSGQWTTNGGLVYLTSTTQNVGIGTTSPGAKLDVQGIGYFSALGVGVANPSGQGNIVVKSAGNDQWIVKFIKSSDTNTLGGFYQDSGGNGSFSIGAADGLVNKVSLNSSGNSYLNGGNVGIGTSTPSYKLDVVGTSQFSQPVIVGTPTAVTHATTKSYVDSMFTGSGQWTTNGGLVYLTSTTQNVGIGTTSPGNKLDVSGAFDVVAVSTEKVLNLGLQRVSADSILWYTGDLVIKSGATGGGGDRVFIRASGNIENKGTLTVSGTGNSSIAGNVGIGITAPIAKLHIDIPVGTTVGSNIGLRIGDATGGVGNVHQIGFGFNYSSTILPSAVIGGINVDNGGFTIDELFFATRNVTTDTAPTERMRISRTGNVGIGTTGPGVKLDVVGSTGLGLQDTQGGYFMQNYFSSTNPRLAYYAPTAGGFQIGSQTSYGGSGWSSVMTFLNSGNVGIATTTPSYKLDVVGTSQFSQPVIVGTPTAITHATTKSYVDSMFTGSGQWTTSGGLVYLTSTTQNVGIGTTGPSSRLNVVGATDNEAVTFQSPQSAISNTYVAKFLTTNNAGVGGTLAQTVSFFAESATEGTNQEYARIIAQQTAATVGAQTGDLQFSTMNAGTLNTGIILKGSGNVGIGTTSPGQKLQVNGNVLFTGTGGAFGSNSLYIGDTNWGMSTISDGLVGDTLRINFYDAGNRGFGFYDTAGSQYRMVIKSGNVGIGTSTPSYKLDVVGTSQFSQPVIVGTPTAVTHATTKSYVDSMFTGSGQWTTNGGLVYLTSTTQNVGIGTTNPGYKLEIGALSGSVEPTSLKISGGATNVTQIRLGDNYTASLGTRYSGADTILSSNSYQNILGADSWSKTASTYSSAAAVLGIGAATTSPAFQIKYSPANTVTGAYGSFFTTDLFTVLGNGNVGIGTTNPINGKLEVTTSGTTPAIFTMLPANANAVILQTGASEAHGWKWMQDEVTTGDMFLKARNSSVDSTNPTIYFKRSNGNVGIGTSTPSYKLDVVGTSQFSQPVIVGTPTAVTHATTKSYVDSMFTGSGQWTTNGGLVYLTSTTQNVGIGTTGPGAKLTVLSSGGTQGAQIYGNGARSIGWGSTSDLGILTYNGNIPIVGSAGAYDLWFVTNNAVSSPSMVIQQSTGNVGIGTTNPGALLQISPLRGGTQAIPLVVNAMTSSAAGEAQFWMSTIDTATSQFRLMFGSGNGTRIAGVKANNNGGRADLVFETYSSGIANLAERMMIDSSGNVGIATTTPSYKLDVVGTSQFSQPVIVGTPTAVTHATTKSYVDSMFTGSGQWTTNGGLVYLTSTTQNVGIGTTAPGAKLDVDGQIISRTGGVQVKGVSSHSTGLGIWRAGDAVQALFIGNDGGTTPRIASNNAPLAFGSDLSGTWTEHMRIVNGTGNVGIGTTSPGAKLDVAGDISLWGSDGSRRGYLTSDGTDSFLLVRGGYNNAGGIKLQTQVGGTFYDRVYIQNGGNVGIGTSTPSYKLDVVGTSQFSQPVIVGTPTANTHATTKSYVDSMFTGSGQWTTNGGLVYLTSTTQNVGIGTTGPLAKLEVYGVGSSPSVTEKGIFGISSASTAEGLGIGQYTTSPYSWWIQPYDRRLDYLSTRSLVLNPLGGNVGIGTTGPGAKLDVTGGNIRLTTAQSKLVFDSPYRWIQGTRSDGDYLTIAQNIYAPGIQLGFDDTVGGAFQPKVTILANGNVGIATTTPSYALTVNGYGWFNQPVIVGTPTNAGHAATKSYVDSIVGGGAGSGSFTTLAVSGTSTLSGNWQLGGAALGNINMNGYNIVGVNKITASVIDPLYEIDGEMYATYGSSVAGGIREEYVGRGNLQQTTYNKQQYQYTIDFSKIERGSDLWVWYNVVDFSKDNVEVLTTAYDSLAKIGYRIEGKKIIFFGDQASEFSFRLFGKRHDWKEWGTKRDTEKKASFILKAK